MPWLKISFLFLIALPVWADVCEVRFSRLTPATGRQLQLKMGEPVRVTVSSSAGTEKVSAFFMGRSSDRNRIFLADKEGKIFSLDAESTKLQDKKGSPLFLPAEKTPDVTEIAVVKQKYEDCAVHSTVNCVLFLRHQGLLPDSPLLDSASRDSLYDMFKEVDSSYIGERMARAERANKASGRGFFGNLFFGARAESQTSLRQRLLARRGIPSKSISADETKTILRHLESGLPVILDVPVNLKKQTMVDIRPDGQTAKKVTTTAPNSSDSVGGHAVVAMGVVKTGWFAKRIVVADSYSGEISLWKPSDLNDSYSGKATLVFPDDRSLKKAYPED